ncbi:MAG TPA: hypothetical protein VGM56_28155 [Byssovorax sp.]
MGLPSNDLTGASMVFEPGSQTLGLNVWIVHERLRLGRVYVRNSPSEKYVLVGAPSDVSSDVSLVASSGPYFWFLRQVAQGAGEHRGFSAVSIVRVSLLTLTSEAFPVSGGVLGGAFVSSIVSASSDGASVFVTLGIPTPQSKIEYWIGRIDLSPMIRATKLRPLLAVFA